MKAMTEEKTLSEFKENYKELAEKYALPSFEELNIEFGIEKIYEIESDFTLKYVSRVIYEKITFYLKLVEGLINPSEGSLFAFKVLECLSAEEKEKLSDLYKEFFEVEINMLERDLEYSEKKEAEFIKKMSEKWKTIKKPILDIIKNIRFDKCKEVTKNKKFYFG